MLHIGTAAERIVTLHINVQISYPSVELLPRTELIPCCIGEHTTLHTLLKSQTVLRICPCVSILLRHNCNMSVEDDSGDACLPTRRA